LKVSCIEKFMPCPALGLCVWQASPAMNTCGRREPMASAGTSSYLSQMRWPISYTDHHGTSFTSSVNGCRMARAVATSLSSERARCETRSSSPSLSISTYRRTR
jgi:hypothetical protein